MQDAADAEVVAAVRHAILRHVAAHRECADTAEGVRTWWLPAELSRLPDRIVRSALQQLVDERVLKEHYVAGSGRIFSVHPERRGE